MNNAVDANNSRANLREGTGGERGLLPLTVGRKTGGGEPKLKKKKKFPGRKEVRLALGHQRAHGQVCTGKKVVISTIVRKWDCGRGDHGALESAESGEGPRCPGELGRPGRTGAAAGAAAFCSGPRWVFAPLPFVPAPRAGPPAPPPPPPPPRCY